MSLSDGIGWDANIKAMATTLTGQGASLSLLTAFAFECWKLGASDTSQAGVDSNTQALSKHINDHYNQKAKGQ